MSEPVDLTRLVALQPSTVGTVVHLRLPDWRPSDRRRGTTRAPLCGNFVADFGEGDLEEGRVWAATKDGRGRPRQWCHSCLGRLAQLTGVEDRVIGVAQTRVARAAASREYTQPPLAGGLL